VRRLCPFRVERASRTMGSRSCPIVQIAVEPMIVRPNNDARPIYDADGNKLVGEVNDPWLWEPVNGMLEVIADCGDHVGWLPKGRVGFEVPECPKRCSKALGGKLETSGARVARLRRERKKTQTTVSPTDRYVCDTSHTIKEPEHSKPELYLYQQVTGTHKLRVTGTLRVFRYL